MKARGILWTTFLQDDQLVAALRDDSKIDVFDAEKDLEHKKILHLDDFVVKIRGCDSKIIPTKESAVDFVDVDSSLKTVSTYEPSKSFKQNTPIGDQVVFTEKPKQFAVTTPGGAVNLYDIRTAKNEQPIYQVQNTGKLRRLTFVNNRMCCITPGDAFKIYTKNECFEFQEEEYSDQGTAKITDFGLSTNTRGLTACGTEQYKAPEMWAHEEQTPGVDMWSLGCIIFEALTKRLTFPQAKTSDMNAAIESAKVSYPHHLSNILKDLIQKLIVRKAGSRLTTSQVLDHTWIKKYQIEKNRGYARELLNEI
ncbi:hypothetical protein CRE_13770 [Caenorhabditis remanei]|uniref:Protein kinase domain-containing protein n=1 Tax=Caenorhabditis remanei TaxID=31234 RepID=E3NJM9_CAERE|nr:hypothetical protein CRE_13770 [Caenorhabditis remanei]